MKKIFAVFCDTNGAHEREDVMSLWTLRDAADREVSRLSADKDNIHTTYGGDFRVEEVSLDKQSNEPMN